MPNQKMGSLHFLYGDVQGTISILQTVKKSKNSVGGSFFKPVFPTFEEDLQVQPGKFD